MRITMPVPEAVKLQEELSALLAVAAPEGLIELTLGEAAVAGAIELDPHHLVSCIADFHAGLKAVLHEVEAELRRVRG
jgi:hypothetical protein